MIFLPEMHGFTDYNFKPRKLRLPGRFEYRSVRLQFPAKGRQCRRSYPEFLDHLPASSQAPGTVPTTLGSFISSAAILASDETKARK
jgi:hypothetical protein